MTVLRWPPYPLFEYEYQLAEREAQALVGIESVKSFSGGLEVLGPLPRAARHRLTYFASEETSRGQRSLPQFETEQRHRAVTGRRGVRQATRFSVHDLHEYKGRFNPQMARALINIMGPDAAVVIDPYCGSGTTLVEALRMGLSVVGTDLNPFAVWMANSKVEILLTEDVSALRREFGVASRKVMRRLGSKTDSIAQGQLSDAALTYLSSWFPESSLRVLTSALAIASKSEPVVSLLLKIAVSRVARELSLQLPEDLRIRRRSQGLVPANPEAILDHSLEHVGAIVSEMATVSILRSRRRPQVSITMRSAKNVALDVTKLPRQRLAIVTSPPYATALPYIDTDRLSMILLGLCEPRDLRSSEALLTGSREWNSRDASRWHEMFDANLMELPSSIMQLLRVIQQRNIVDKAGFRRRALPPLLYRYFAEIREAIVSWGSFTTSGDTATLVLGQNTTGGSTNPIVIETPSLIAPLLEGSCWNVKEIIPFQAWPRYGMHAKNAVQRESAVVLERE